MSLDRDAFVSSFVAESHEGLDLMEQSLLAMESSSAGPELLNDVFRVCHTIKGNATSLGFEDVAGFAHASEDLLDALREQNKEVGGGEISLLLKAVDALRALVAATPRGNPRLTAEQQELKQQIADEVKNQSQQAGSGQSKGRVQSASAKAGALPGGAGRTLRADIEKLDRMLNLTAEIVIAQGRLRGLIERIDSELGREILEVQGETERLFRSLQEETMAVRMVPIGTVLRQTARSVRDLANSHSKLARIEVAGGDVEVDAAMLEPLKDALLHMIRNAIDHGIEIPPVRKKLLTVQEIAVFLKVPVSWVYGHVRGRSSDPLPGYRVGKYWRFRAEEVLAWVRRHTTS